MYQNNLNPQAGQLIAKADYNYNSQAPPGPPPPPPPTTKSSDSIIRKYLSSNGWPTGLQDAFITGSINCPVRYFICDDSGSMMSSDGHRVVGEGTHAR